MNLRKNNDFLKTDVDQKKELGLSNDMISYTIMTNLKESREKY